MTETFPRSLGGALWAGARGRCPRCRQGSLFDGFLGIVVTCATCGLHFAGHDAGDAPAVAAIFILGAAVVGAAISVEFKFLPPMWVHVAIWPVVVSLGTVAILRPLKGMAIALQYHFRSVEEPERPGGA